MEIIVDIVAWTLVLSGAAVIFVCGLCGLTGFFSGNANGLKF